MKVIKVFFGLSFMIILAGISWISCKVDNTVDPQVDVDGIMFAILRNVNEGVVSTDKVHGYAIMDFNPFSEKFGDTLQTINGPLGHHGYISPINGGLYVTQSDELAARVHVTIEASGLPKIKNISPSLDDGGMRVGEDIVWFKEKQRKKMPKKANKVQINAVVTEAIGEDLDKFAEEEGVSRSAYIGKILTTSVKLRRSRNKKK